MDFFFLNWKLWLVYALILSIGTFGFSFFALGYLRSKNLFVIGLFVNMGVCLGMAVVEGVGHLFLNKHASPEITKLFFFVCLLIFIIQLVFYCIWFLIYSNFIAPWNKVDNGNKERWVGGEGTQVKPFVPVNPNYYREVLCALCANQLVTGKFTDFYVFINNQMYRICQTKHAGTPLPTLDKLDPTEYYTFEVNRLLFNAFAI